MFLNFSLSSELTSASSDGMLCYSKWPTDYGTRNSLPAARCFGRRGEDEAVNLTRPKAKGVSR